MNAKHAASFLLVGLTLASLAGCGEQPRFYPLERVISFGAGGESERYRGEGWGATEPHFTWTTAPVAKLHFQLRPIEGPLGVRIRLGPAATATGSNEQLVLVYANGGKVAEWRVHKVDDFVTTISPKALNKRSDLEIELRLPRATSPQSLGINDDVRLLGVSCYELDLSRGVRMKQIWPARASAEGAAPGP